MVYDSLFLRSTSSCLLYMCSIIMVIQSYKMFRHKIHKKLELSFGSKCERDKTRKVRSIRYKYRREFLLTAQQYK